MSETRTYPTDVIVSGRYRPLRLIGRGGMATVYLARDEFLGRDVALKLFKAAAPGANELAHHQAELRVLAALGHHGIVTLLDAGIDDTLPSEPHPYLVMELVTGGNLETLLAHGPMSPRAIAEIGYDLAEALDYVHSRRIVHRDIKPSNVLIAQYGDTELRARARLTDFGIALDSDSARAIDEGVATGTAAYLSPEQVQRDVIGSASDVYSLGLVLLECFTRTLAFPGEPTASAVARLRDDPYVPEELGTNWRELITAMTARSPVDRPPIREVRLALRQLTMEETGKHRPMTAMPHDEEQRMKAVRRYDVLNSGVDSVADRVTSLAARVFDAPVALVSVVDTDRIFFVSHHGIEFDEVERADGLCATAMLEVEPFVVEDARVDPRTKDNPWITGEFGLQFYASTRLQTRDGFTLGTLCVLDYEPREISAEQLESLKDLAAVVMDELELRHETKQLHDELRLTSEFAHPSGEPAPGMAPPGP